MVLWNSLPHGVSHLEEFKCWEARRGVSGDCRSLPTHDFEDRCRHTCVFTYTCTHKPQNHVSFKYSFLKTVVSRRIGDFAPFRRGEPEAYRNVCF